MATETEKQIRIDLDQFKLHLNIEQEIQLSLHFDTPSRKFYLSVMALVLNEMRKNQGVKSISLKTKQELLVLLNETVGKFAGSSEKEKLIQRIYKKWKTVLPNLENAPLFRIIGRKKEFGSGIDKVYVCNDVEKDSWANLFDYIGSGENVRLRFSVDALGVGFDNSIIKYKDSKNQRAWDRFVSDLEKKWKKETTIDKPASVDKMAYPLPDKPSIAVLPFKNLSGDPEQEYFSDGLTEQIITTLSKTPKLFVIARHSTFTYKGKPVKVQQVSEELGVRCVLEGSVRKSNDRIRITAQLIDALTGHHLWAEQYDRKLEDIFAIQDDITIKILVALQIKLTEGERISEAMRTKNVEAYLKTLKSNEYQILHTRENNIRSRQLAQEATELDPDYFFGWLCLAHTHLMDVHLGWADSPKKSVERAVELTRKAEKLWGKEWHHIWAWIHWLGRRYEKAISKMQKAVAESPNDDFRHMFLGQILVSAGRPQDGIVAIKKAMRLNPFYPTWYLWWLAQAYEITDRYDEAIAGYKGVLTRGDYDHPAHIGLAATYIYVGREDQAKAHAKKLLKINPKFKLDLFRQKIHFKDQMVLDRKVEALCKAGLS